MAALTTASAQVMQHQEILVDLSQDEVKELTRLRRHAVGTGIVAIAAAVTCWSAYITPWITSFVAVPTCYVAHMRMQNVQSLLQGHTCWCSLCGQNTRNTLKACRPASIACTVLACISVVTQIAFLADHGQKNTLNNALGVVGVICLLILLVLGFALGLFAYRFGRAVQIFDAVTRRQHLRQSELAGGAIGNAVGAVTNAVSGAFGRVGNAFRGARADTNANSSSEMHPAGPPQGNHQAYSPRDNEGASHGGGGGQPMYQV